MWQRITLFRIWLAAGAIVMPTIGYMLGQHSTGLYIAGYGAWIAVYLTVKLLYRNSERKAATRASQQWQQQLANFKQNATVINVALRDCEVLANNYILEHDGYNSNQPKMAMLEIASAQQGKNIIRQQVTSSQVVFEHNCTKYVSPVLSIPKESLLFLFDKQKETKLYVDAEKGYYFDLDFLNT